MTAQPCILIADDEINDRISLRDLLEAHRYVVLEASNTEEAVRAASAQLPDLIVLDVEMPTDDGYVVCRRLRADPRTRAIPILMLTCHGFADERVTGLRAGADDYVVKPCDNEELLARIESLFRRYPARSDYIDRLKRAHEGIQAAEHFRRPVTVLSIDVQGSTTALADPRDEYLKTITFFDYRKIVDEEVSRHSGSPASWAGDGATAEFATAGESAAAAIRIMRRVRSEILTYSMTLRIGIAAGSELLQPDAEVGKRTSRTHDRAGHFQKLGGPNTITVGNEIRSLAMGLHFRERAPIDGEAVFEVAVD